MLSLMAFSEGNLFFTNPIDSNESTFEIFITREIAKVLSHIK
ncbi:hypothetical protein O53_582 [Microcystis aeruginosa TAIHU98]|uniref:Uncharacterized protein n=1 Tax=Microcystis aeruginosa TAIHU98 TaxID=1134457 RepID=L7EBD0_MICAE|nr:hypothetical protein O53_582 [Microcystis aeruginosa TAIHU98]